VGHCVLKYPNAGDPILPRGSRPASGKISGISSFVRETPAQNGRVGRYGFVSDVEQRLFSH
jgi:hypothetical protein